MIVCISVLRALLLLFLSFRAPVFAKRDCEVYNDACNPITEAALTIVKTTAGLAVLPCILSVLGLSGPIAAGELVAICVAFDKPFLTFRVYGIMDDMAFLHR
ncbi:hypothetical protein CC80DRAFT_541928 [Byssothecium circinans]|uniref:Uncharacterized protein n=1 Tax=Byssothecium circinans TaxID=147558 RepID=A0A6A5UCW9_9PLEO|nr:hypothetical protein CC80DRAFT_541928 [Byssothecium circinans]